jgi:DNA replication protein DnaC
MDDQQTQPATAVPDTDQLAELYRYVAGNREHLPPLPQRLNVPVPIIPVAVAELSAERERRSAERAELRHKAELFERWKSLLAAAGARYADCTLSNFRCDCPEQTRVVAALRDYIAEDCPAGVILFGPVGTGKDHLAFAVCRSALKAGKLVRWINGQNWFGIVRDAMDTDRSEASLIADLARPELLCLSDPLPPVGPLTQFQATMLYRLVDARYSRGVPTICTINVADDSEADERMGAATWDRLTHDAWKIKCNWPTYRQPARTI